MNPWTNYDSHTINFSGGDNLTPVKAGVRFWGLGARENLGAISVRKHDLIVFNADFFTKVAQV